MFEKEKIHLKKSEFINAINISLGIYKPLDRFCNFEDYKSILNKKIINKNDIWTIPILLNLKKNYKIKLGKKYYLYFNNRRIGFVNAESIFKIDKKKFCKTIFNTNSKIHPSVKEVHNLRNLYLGGKIKIYQKFYIKDKHFVYNYFKKNNKFFSSSVVFSTRNFCHLGHEFIHKSILNKNKNLCICIIESEKNKFDPKFIINSYKKLKIKKFYSSAKIVKIFLPSLMAGPREAYLQAACFKNLGFHSILIGRDHAGFKTFFKKYDSQKIFENLKNLNIKVINTKEPLMCKLCEKISFEDKVSCNCKKTNNLLKINGKEIKKYLINYQFEKAKKFLDPIILKFCKENIKIITKFKT